MSTKNVKATLGSLPEGSVFHASMRKEPPYLNEDWAGAGVVVAQKSDVTEVYLNCDKYMFLINTMVVNATIVAAKKPAVDKSKLKKLRTRFDTQGKPLNRYKPGDIVLIWRPALEEYEGAKIIRVSKKGVMVEDEEGRGDLISGYQKALPFDTVSEDEIP